MTATISLEVKWMSCLFYLFSHRWFPNIRSDRRPFSKPSEHDIGYCFNRSNILGTPCHL